MSFSHVKPHFPAIGIAVAVGLLFGSHHILVPRFLDQSRYVYAPITRATYYDESILYAPRANAAFLDWDVGGDASVAEHRGAPATLSVLGPLLMALLGRLAGSLTAGFILSDFLFPASAFFILYLLVVEMTGRRLAAVLFAAAFIFFPSLGMKIPPLSSAALGEVASPLAPFLRSSEPLIFSTFDEPKFTFLFAALAWLFLYRALRDPRSRLDAVASGASFGLLFYTYFYDWPVFVVALAIAAIFFLATRQYERAKVIGFICLIGFVFSIPYWWNLLQVWRLPQFDELAARAGTEVGRRLRFATVWKSYLRDLSLAAILGMLARPRGLREWTPMHQVSAFLATYFFVVNAQVVLGINPEPDHWYRTQFLPVGIAFLLIGLWAYDHLPRVGRSYGRAAAWAFLVYFLASVGAWQYAYARESAEKFGVPVERMASYRWLAAHTPKGSVVGTLDPGLNAELGIHTRNNIFLPYGVATIASNEELWDRFMALAEIFGLTPEEFEAGGREALIDYLFVGQFGNRSFDAAFAPARLVLPSGLVEEKVRAYAARKNQPGRIPYRLDYLYSDAASLRWGRDPELILPFLQPVYQSEGIKIYAFSDQP